MWRELHKYVSFGKINLSALLMEPEMLFRVIKTFRSFVSSANKGWLTRSAN
jgi:hypothetical protein